MPLNEDRSGDSAPAFDLNKRRRLGRPGPGRLVAGGGRARPLPDRRPHGPDVRVWAPRHDS